MTTSTPPPTAEEIGETVGSEPWELNPVPKPKREDRLEKERSRKRGGFYGPEWLKTHKPVALKRDGYRCLWCGSRDDVQVHHIEHIGMKGRDENKHALPNLISLCWRHHAQAEDGTISRAECREKLRQLYGYPLEGAA